MPDPMIAMSVAMFSGESTTTCDRTASTVMAMSNHPRSWKYGDANGRSIFSVESDIRRNDCTARVLNVPCRRMRTLELFDLHSCSVIVR
jgi:hypothetical protein